MVAWLYQRGKALNVATHYTIDHVSDPADSRRWMSRALRLTPPPQRGTSKNIHSSIAGKAVLPGLDGNLSARKTHHTGAAAQPFAIVRCSRAEHFQPGDQRLQKFAM
jgi:hypothetical protein